MKQHTHKKTGGFSLVEALWAAGLLSLVLGSVLLVGNAGTKAQHVGMVANDVDLRLRKAMDLVTLELQPSGMQLLTPDPAFDPFNPAANTGFTDLVFEQSTGVVGGVAAYGNPQRLSLEYELGETDNGVDDDGDGLIDEGQLVLTRALGQPGELRVVLCRGIPEFLEGEIENGVDDNGNGLVDERGFCIIREDGQEHLILRLSLVREERDQRILRTLETAVRPRNTK